MPTLTADGSSDWTPAKGPFHLHLSGNFGGGTAQLEFKDTLGNTRSIANGSLTTASDKRVSTGFNTEVRITLSGSTSPALIYDIISSTP